MLIAKKLMMCLGIVVMALTLLLPASHAAISDEQRQFINMMVSKHQFDENALHTLFAESTANEAILQAIAKPWEAKPWFEYYPIFLTEKRLKKGLEFWQQHQTTLARAEQLTGVPASVIVAILGVETFYGTYTGKYSVFDALNTLGFHYPRRATFFRSELEQLLLLAREEKFELAALQGSYAGAMGWGQFIPSSYRAYALDFDGDGVRDLLNNPVDAIGSVANYFKRHGWQAGQAVAYPVEVSGQQYQRYLSKKLKPQHTWQTLQQAGVRLSLAASQVTSLKPDSQVKLLELAGSEVPEYWLVLGNFYTITRYNHSPLYAMVVHQLSQQLEQAFKPHVSATSLFE